MTAPATGSSRIAPLEGRGHLFMSRRIASIQDPPASKTRGEGGWVKARVETENAGVSRRKLRAQVGPTATATDAMRANMGRALTKTTLF
jgi:hypothetical protein